MINRQNISQALLFLALAGAFVSSSLIAGSVLLLALIGGYLIKSRTLIERGWETPKELRLIHFAFWFFVLTSVASWMIEGFGREGGKTLETHARFILFWPLAIALIGANVRAKTIFTAALIASTVITLLFIWELSTHSWNLNQVLQSRFGAGINPIQFGNIALLCALFSLLGGFFFYANRQKTLATLAMLLGITALAIALASQTRSNLVALPVLLCFFLLLIPGKKKFAAFALIVLIGLGSAFSSDRFTDSIEAIQAGELDSSVELRFQAWSVAWEQFTESPIIGAGLSGYNKAARLQESSAFLSCCTGHAHSDLMNLAATKGSVGVLSWALLLIVPFVVFIRQKSDRNRNVSILAVAGAMIPTAYLLFGLTEATFDRSLFLTFYLLTVAAVATALFNELTASYTRQRTVKVSATVITKNEEDHIAECLQSARLVADEIIVLDSGSTDNTAEIARQYADVVEVTDWPGFGIQKQRALEKASGEWVLSIDADERITPELAREINHVLADPDADAYKLPWAVTIYGKRLDFGRSGRAPLRLFRREGVRFSEALVHERILIPEGRSVRTLRGRLTHYTHRDFGHALLKGAQYAWLGSKEKHRQGKRSRTLMYASFRGLLTFIQVYIVRFGFLDGPVGYLQAVLYGQVTFNKYAGLWTLSRTGDSESNED
ncbi:glycosyltransferase [Marinobacter sp.]|uniref:glycosyltransferase n=1 Tax=Marinobacter sp. TaxID=50741 RepID=UPI0019DA330F|nr:glycosyltransferase [Marinobacter sp.]MBE0487083.1 glycosyltransferase [Marinobacter sp.]